MASLSERERAREHDAPARNGERLLLVAFAVFSLLLASFFVLVLNAPEGTVRDLGRWTAGFLERQPFFSLFATMAAGFALAKLQVKGVSVGATAGTLLVALGLSSWASARHGATFRIPELANTIFFDLFMFAIGMKIGPQFLGGLHRGVRNHIGLAVAVPLLSAGLLCLLDVLLDPPYGTTAGIFAGANTATPGLGAATAALASSNLQLPPGVDRAQAMGNLGMAFAFSYCIGAVSFVVLLRALPRLSRREAVAEARQFKLEVGTDRARPPGEKTTFVAGTLPVERRTYRLTQPELVGTSLAKLRDELPWIDVEHVRRGGQELPLADALRLAPSDEITIFGNVAYLIELEPRLGPELVDPTLAPLELETVEVVQANDAVIGKTLRELAADVGHGIHLNSMSRAGEELPRPLDVSVRKGDVLRVTGSARKLARLVELVGPALRPSPSTDVLTLALGLALGALLGALTLRIGQIELTLDSLALLLTGMALSMLRTRNPALGGPFPEPARQLIEDLGLNVFVAGLGLNAGASVLAAMQGGLLLPVLIGTLCAGLLPALAAWWFGLARLKMNAAELLGAVAGARCASPGLRAAREACQSTVPATAYPVAFALSNVLLTVLSYLLAALD